MQLMHVLQSLPFSLDLRQIWTYDRCDYQLFSNQFALYIWFFFMYAYNLHDMGQQEQTSILQEICDFFKKDISISTHNICIKLSYLFTLNDQTCGSCPIGQLAASRAQNWSLRIMRNWNFLILIWSNNSPFQTLSNPTCSWVIRFWILQLLYFKAMVSIIIIFSS